MSVYARFKRDPNGFRSLVELLESTPPSRRQKMIDVGMAEDAEYTEKALSYMMTWEDILKLPEPEVAEVCVAAPAKVLAFAIHGTPKETIDKWIRCSKPQVAGEIREIHGSTEITAGEENGARLKLITYVRKLEKEGYVRTKQIPLSVR